LQGLSSDELEFIADYFGSCILESNGTRARTRAEMAMRVAQFQALRASARAAANQSDNEHKMILLLEFLCQGGLQAALSRRPS
jgi:hypothetical protein